MKEYKKPETPEEWKRLFQDFGTFQFGAGQASIWITPGIQITQEQAESWERAREEHYGCNRGQMMQWLREKMET